MSPRGDVRPRSTAETTSLTCEFAFVSRPWLPTGNEGPSLQVARGSQVPRKQERIQKPKPPRRMDYGSEQTFEDSRTKRERTRGAKLRAALHREWENVEEALSKDGW